MVGGGLQVGTEAGQTQVAIAEDEHLAGHQKKPAAGDRHHRVPHQADGGVGQFHLDEALPPTPAVNLRGFLHLARNAFERGVETEGHVPNLPGKNQKDRTEFDAKLARWKQRHHGHHYRRKKTEDRDGLQGIQKRKHVALGAGVVSGDVTVDEGESQAEHIRNGDAQYGKHRVLRQHPRTQADFGALGDRSHPVVGEREQRVEKREARQDYRKVGEQRGKLCGKQYPWGRSGREFGGGAADHEFEGTPSLECDSEEAAREVI